jgi:hypothetical protein
MNKSNAIKRKILYKKERESAQQIILQLIKIYYNSNRKLKRIEINNLIKENTKFNDIRPLFGTIKKLEEIISG